MKQLSSFMRASNYQKPNCYSIEVNKKQLGTQEKVKSNSGCTEGAWMTSQPSHNFQASEAVHGAHNSKIYEPGLFNEDLWSQVDTLIY